MRKMMRKGFDYEKECSNLREQLYSGYGSNGDGAPGKVNTSDQESWPTVKI
jgi:hypothetical protein